MVELRYDALSLDQCVGAVRTPGSGGLAVFVGSVRAVSEGKQVTQLDYEAYEPMALEKLNQVADEARSRWPIDQVAVQHRLGTLRIGDDAVIVAVSSPHRAEAFEACRYIIDRLKEVVPIWKKEHGEAGDVWVGGPSLATQTSSRDRDKR